MDRKRSDAGGELVTSRRRLGLDEEELERRGREMRAIFAQRIAVQAVNKPEFRAQVKAAQPAGVSEEAVDAFTLQIRSIVFNGAYDFM